MALGPTFIEVALCAPHKVKEAMAPDGSFKIIWDSSATCSMLFNVFAELFSETALECKCRMSQKWRSEETPVHLPHEDWKALELGSVAFEGDKPTLPVLAEADDIDLKNCIAAKVMLPQDGHTFASGEVVCRARNP